MRNRSRSRCPVPSNVHRRPTILFGQSGICQSQYAEKKGFTITQSYTDAAKSGVVLRRRSGLRQLLQDVIRGHPAFKVILVYDVSRWGRFQDSDEAAHYEFMCKSAGVPIHYCAEPFANDGSIPDTMMKALKRTMAAEYSRELGVKVRAGMQRLSGLGFYQGGPSGYGLRRMLVTSDRQIKQQLARGEHKNLTTDRVVLVPGPPDELQCVREIYRMFISEGRTVAGIARELNRRAIPGVNGGKWWDQRVFDILTNLKYIGCQVYGRTAQRLFTPTAKKPVGEWLVTAGSHEPVVDLATFRDAQQILARRTIRKSNDELLEQLRFLLAKHGALSLSILQTSGMPSASTYAYRFGSIGRAFELAGYRSARSWSIVETRKQIFALREQLISRLLELFPNDLKVTHPTLHEHKRIQLKSGRCISVVFGRADTDKRMKGEIRWQVGPVTERRLMVLLVRLERKNRSIRDMYVLSKMAGRNTRFTVRLNDPCLRSGERLRKLPNFLKVVCRVLKKRDC